MATRQISYNTIQDYLERSNNDQAKEYTKPDLFHNNTILSHQQPFISSMLNEILFVGGMGAGKSDAVVKRALKLKYENPDQSILVLEPTWEDIKFILYPKFEEELEKMGIERDRWDINRADHFLWFKDMKGHIKFKNMDNPSAIKGTEYAHAIIDEIDRMNSFSKAMEAFVNVQARIRSVHGGTIALATTPEGYFFAYHKFAKGKVLKPTSSDSPVAYEDGVQMIVKAKSTDNPFLPSDYVENMIRNYPPKLQEAYIHGDFVNFRSGSVYYEFDDDKHLVDHIEPDLSEPVYICCDFNVNHGVYSMVQVKGGLKLFEGSVLDSYKIENVEIRVFDEVYLETGSYTKVMINHTINKLKNRFDQVIIIGDASGRNTSTQSLQSDYELIEQEFINAGYHRDRINMVIPRSNPAVRDRINSFNAVLDKATTCLDKENCIRNTEDLRRVVYTDKGEIDKTSDMSLTHASDGLGYLVYMIAPLRRLKMPSLRSNNG